MTAQEGYRQLIEIIFEEKLSMILWNAKTKAEKTEKEISMKLLDKLIDIIEEQSK